MNKLLDLLKNVAKAYADLLDLKTPLGAGVQGERNSLADSLATLSSSIAAILAVVAFPTLAEPLNGIDLQPEELLFAGFLVLLAWFIATYVFLAARDFARFKSLAPLNLNLVLVWFFITLFVVVLVSYAMGTPGNRATQSIVAFIAVTALVVVHVATAAAAPPRIRVCYALALILSITVVMDRMYGYPERFGMHREWFDFAKGFAGL